MKNKLIITDYNNKTLYAYIEDTMLTELSFEGSSSILGNIYVARVQNIVKNLNAAFVEIEKGILCYYSIDQKHIFLNNKNNDKLVIGDLILVQIEKDAIKTKNAVATANISISGKYIVLDMSGNIGVSNKIQNTNSINILKGLATNLIADTRYGIILRTVCENTNEDYITAEIKSFVDILSNILTKASHLCYGQLVYAKNTDIKHIEEYGSLAIDEIIVDSPTTYNSLKEYYNEYDIETSNKIILYIDSMLSLNALYNLNKQIEDALKKNVWLKSGGYLVIEPTEAMVVIDVNTGKSTAKKNREENFYKVNVEAAIEIAKQLRLRNLSGIILIDFINMRSNYHKNKLISILSSELKKDKIQTFYIDTTKLDLVEVTRKKTRGTIFQQLKD